jgi:hypothetical protein
MVTLSGALADFCADAADLVADVQLRASGELHERVRHV